MKTALILIVMIFHICTAAWAQETGQVVVPLSGKYIREWLVLGPLFPDDLDTDFLARIGGEANVQPKEGDTVATADGRTLTWKRYKSKGNKVSLLDAVGNYENATAYAFCTLQNEIAGDARVYMGSDDGVAVWVNGKQVHHHDVGRALRLDQDMFKAHLKAGANRCLVKVSQGTEAWGFAMRADLSPPNYAVLSGRVTDAAGRPVPNAHVRLEQNVKEVAETQTDASGRYRLNIYPARGSYNLSATEGERGGWQFGIRLREGQRRRLNLTLRKAISIEGTLLMLDDKTPHVAVPVQAVVAQASLPVKMARRGEPRVRPIATALSDENGKYQLINLRPGRYQLRCQVLGGYVYYPQTTVAPASLPVKDEGQTTTGRDARATEQREILQVRRGKTLRNINFRFAPFKKGMWKNYNTLDGLAGNHVYTIYRDPDGMMWFGTWFGGVSRYDGKTFVNFTAEDGLASNLINAIHRDPDGVMWFGTVWGVSCYDGLKFTNFTMQDRLIDNTVFSVYCDPDGVVWFGMPEGISRYDGKTVVNLTTKDGLAGENVWEIHRTIDGAMWFGTGGDGVSRYDGQKFTNFTTENGLVANNDVRAIHCDPDGVMWFGTAEGVSRYDGKESANLTTEDGLANNHVSSIYRDLDGVMWFGTYGGVSRYDGRTFVNFTTEDGLASNYVNDICRGPDGVIWVATGDIEAGEQGGVSRYDEGTFANHTTKDGLTNDNVRDILRAPDGVMWLGTWGGVSRYDRKEFVNFTAENDGLADNNVYAIYLAPDDVMWFATNVGVSRYDGKKFVNYTIKDGLASNTVYTIHRDPDGMMWFGTWDGISQYDGKQFAKFIAKDACFSIHRDPDGMMWFGTWGGVSRYDGKEIVKFAAKDVLEDKLVSIIYRDPNGMMWFGTNEGVLRYDGREFVKFTTKDGLANNLIRNICHDANGDIWVGTEGGVSCYDGVAWTSLDTRDGLAGNTVGSILQDPDGYLWFGTNGGLTRYRRSTTPPRACIVSVTTDRTYRDLSAIPAFMSGTRVTIEYSSIDFKTLPEKRQYRCRINDVGARHASPLQWGKPTKATQFDWTSRKAGTYNFEVQAIDRDLNYSEPASLSIVISGLPFFIGLAFF